MKHTYRTAIPDIFGNTFSLLEGKIVHKDAWNKHCLCMYLPISW